MIDQGFCLFDDVLIRQVVLLLEIIHVILVVPSEVVEKPVSQLLGLVTQVSTEIHKSPAQSETGQLVPLRAILLLQNLFEGRQLVALLHQNVPPIFGEFWEFKGLDVSSGSVVH